jgi:hypothetical protein
VKPFKGKRVEPKFGLEGFNRLCGCLSVRAIAFIVTLRWHLWCLLDLVHFPQARTTVSCATNL